MRREFFFAVLCCLLVGVGDTPAAHRNLQSISRSRSLTHFVDELALTGFGNHPKFARGLLRLAVAAGEDRIVAAPAKPPVPKAAPRAADALFGKFTGQGLPAKETEA